MVKIIPLNKKILKQYLELVPKLWEDIEVKEILETIKEHNNKNGYIVVAMVNQLLVGFINSKIRKDYVEGSEASKTGYIEGIFVLKEFRRQNIAKKMFKHLLKYYKTKEITFIGSDTPITNSLSNRFHKAIGFKEVSVNRHYIYKI